MTMRVCKVGFFLLDEMLDGVAFMSVHLKPLTSVCVIIAFAECVQGPQQRGILITVRYKLRF